MAENKLMTKLTPDVLEKLQATQIEILEEIARICEKHQLRYFMIYGTLIGAIRHKGFIPWDDDLDIGMPRDDYEKFMQVASKELNEKYYLQNNQTESQYWLPFGKVRKNHTLFEETSMSAMSQQVHKGIFVDIFPFDYVKKNSGLFVHLQFIFSKAICETMYYKAGVYKDRNSLRYKQLDLLLNVLPIRWLSNLQRWVSSLQNLNGAKYLADFSSDVNYLSSIFPVNFFFPIKEGVFAEKTFKIPNDYDAYLRMVYGDYMKMPKEEERVNHRTLRIVFDTSEEE